MLKIILLIAIIIFCLLCNLLSFLAGGLVFNLHTQSVKPKKPTDPDPKEVEKINIAKREYENFLNYTGDEQK